MMEGVLPRFWREEFERAALDRREELAHRERTTRIELNERQRKSQERVIEAEKREREDLADLQMALATEQQITAFKVELDDCDTKTVEALMDNQEALAAVRERIDAMLDEAEVLPDGRRVFKTKDGNKVFDEHGQEVAKETIDPDSIDDTKPKWEEFSAADDEHHRLTEERQQLSDYQRKLDDARERLDKGEITERELKKLREELKAEMPDAVREKLDHDQQKLGSNPKPGVPPAAAMPSDMDALMIKTSLGPSPMS